VNNTDSFALLIFNSLLYTWFEKNIAQRGSFVLSGLAKNSILGLKTRLAQANAE